ncbi:MAG: acyltransferase family protein [Pseudomonadota bacterium]
MTSGYRPEIDGLRAIAVISVIAYHARLDGMLGFDVSGGYVGVDIFFVISGYLIARLMLAEIRETGRLRLGAFYMRRARRILPALVIVIAACLPTAWMILPPYALREFGLSALAALTFGSNFFFYVATTDYGATASLTKPLLHTWSLGVEEQFYLIAPLAVLAVRGFSRLHMVALLLLIAVASLTLAELTARLHPAFAFFIPLARFWELTVGIGVAMLEARPAGAVGERLLRAVGRFRPWIAAGGMLAVLGAILLFDETTSHPGLITLVPVLGTAAVLFGCGAGDWTTRILSHPLLRGCGLISFSLYLWHFPIFAFARLEGRMESLGDVAVLFLVTIALSVLTYALVEQPFRRSQRIRTPVFVATLTICLTTIGGTVASFELHEGHPERFERFEGALNIERDNVRLRKESWQLARAKTEFETRDATPVVVIGNSHSKDTFNTLALLPSAYAGFEFLNYQINLACFDPENADAVPEREEFFGGTSYNRAQIVLISTRFNPDRTCISSAYFDHRSSDLVGLEHLIARLARDGKGVVLFGPSVEFTLTGELSVVDYLLAKAERRDGTASLSETEGAAAFAQAVNLAHFRRSIEFDEQDARLRAVAAKFDVPYIDKRNFICSEPQEICWGITPSGHKAFYDYGHYTIEGARFFGERLWNQGFAETLRRLTTMPAPSE